MMYLQCVGNSTNRFKNLTRHFILMTTQEVYSGTPHSLEFDQLIWAGTS